MGAKSRNKGKRGESEVVHILRAIWAEVRRGAAQARKGSDAAGWVCVVVDGRLMHMCLACEKARRGEPK